MKPGKIAKISILVLALLGMVWTAAAVDQLVSLQGKVTSGGSPVDNGNLVVTIYNANISGTMVYNSTSNFNNAIQDGYFDVMLGSITTLDLNYNQYYYMDIKVNSQDLNWSNGADNRLMFESTSGDTFADTIQISGGQLEICSPQDSSKCLTIFQNDTYTNISTNVGDIHIDPFGSHSTNNTFQIHGKLKVTDDIDIGENSLIINATTYSIYRRDVPTASPNESGITFNSNGSVMIGAIDSRTIIPGTLQVGNNSMVIDGSSGTIYSRQAPTSGITFGSTGTIQATGIFDAAKGTYEKRFVNQIGQSPKTLNGSIWVGGYSTTANSCYQYTTLETCNAANGGSACVWSTSNYCNDAGYNTMYLSDQRYDNINGIVFETMIRQTNWNNPGLVIAADANPPTKAYEFLVQQNKFQIREVTGIGTGGYPTWQVKTPNYWQTIPNNLYVNGTFHKLKVFVSPNGEDVARFYIDGNLVFTLKATADYNMQGTSAQVTNILRSGKFGVKSQSYEAQQFQDPVIQEGTKEAFEQQAGMTLKGLEFYFNRTSGKLKWIGGQIVIGGYGHSVLPGEVLMSALADYTYGSYLYVHLNNLFGPESNLQVQYSIGVYGTEDLRQDPHNVILGYAFGGKVWTAGSYVGKITGDLEVTGTIYSSGSPVGTSADYVLKAGDTMTGALNTPSIITPFIKPSTDSATAFQFRKADGTTSVLNVDTTNGRVGIGTTSPGAKLDVADSGAELMYLQRTGANNAVWQFRSSTDIGGAAKALNIQNAVGVDSDIVLRAAATGNGQFILKGTGNVGIGTTGPLTKLHLGGSGPTLRIDYLSATYPTNYYGTIRHDGDSGGFTFTAQSASAGTSSQDFTFQKQTGVGVASTQMVIKASGNVGIGTTTPNAKLQVGSGSDVLGNGAGISIVGADLNIDGGGSSRDASLYFRYTSAVANIKSDRALAFWTGYNPSMSEKVRITNEGNVGIGTTAPSYNLHISNGASDTTLGIKNTINNNLITLTAQTNNVNVMGSTGTFYFQGTTDLRFQSAGAGKIYFDRADASHMVTFDVNNGGNVGIGTTAPVARLQVNTDTTGTQTIANFYGYRTETPASSAIAASITQQSSYGGGKIDLFGTDSVSHARISADGNSYINPQNSGNVGIGTTAPAAKLHVVGDVRIDGNLQILKNISNVNVQTLVVNGTIRPPAGLPGTFDIGDNSLNWRNAYFSGNVEMANLYDVDGTNFFDGSCAYGVASIDATGALTCANQQGAGSVTGTGVAGRVPVWSGASSINSSESFFWDNTNKRLGLGTTAPGQALHINKAVGGVGIRLSADNYGGNMGQIGLDSAGLNFYTGTTPTDRMLISAAGGFSFGSYTGTDPGAGNMIISGNVGIGTTAPTAKLDITATPSDTVGTSFLEFTDVNNNLLKFGIRLDNTNKDLQLDRKYSSTWSNVLTVQRSTGNVGIGTTTPGAKLHVKETTGTNVATFENTAGNIALTTWVNNAGSVYINQIGAQSLGSGNVGLIFRTGLNSAVTKMSIDINGAVGIGDYAGTVLPAAAANGMAISGNVGIGTTAPQGKLHIKGTSDIATFGNSQIKFSVPVSFDSTGDTSVAGKLLLTDASANTIESAAPLYIKTTPGMPKDIVLQPGGGGAVGVQSGLTAAGVIESTSGGFKFPDGTTMTTATMGTTTGTGAAGRVTLWSGTSSINSSESFFWDATNKRLGIGTTSPGNLLHVNGVAQATTLYATSQVATPSVSANYISTSQTLNLGSGTASYLTFSTNGEKVRIDNTGNVGIGTTNPNTKLEVFSSVPTIRLAYADGYGFNMVNRRNNDNPYFDIQYIAQNAVYSTPLSINFNGNVGIGTTAPAYNLQVSAATSPTIVVSSTGTDKISAFAAINDLGSRSIYMSVGGSTATGTQFGVNKANLGYLYTNNMPMAFGTYDNYALTLGTNNAAVMTLLGNGNVGIGTTGPEGILHLAKAGIPTFYMDAYASLDSTDSMIAFRKSNSDTLGTKTATNNGEYLGGFNFKGIGSGGNWANGAYVDVIQEGNAAATLVPTRMEFYTYSGTGVNAGQLVLSSTGNVGIGTTSPGELLHLKSSAPRIAFEDTDGGGALAKISANSANGGLFIQADTGNVGANSQIAFEIDSSRIVQIDAGGSVSIGGTAASTAPLLYVQSTGNVGIGTTTPAAKLHVVGDVRIDGNLQILKNISNVNVQTLVVNGTIRPPAGLGGTFDIGDNNLTWRNGYFGASVEMANLYDVDGTNFFDGSCAYGVASIDATGALTCANQQGAGSVTGTGVAGRVPVWSGASSINSSESFFWDNTNKRLGIGTTAPGYLLDVNGNARVVTSLGVGTTPSGTAGRINANEHIMAGGNVYSAGTYGFVFGTSIGDGEYIYRSGNDISILAGGSDRLYVDGDAGNVGIGTTAPMARLEVKSGSTTSALPAFNVSNNTNSEKLVVLNNGNVGIGTAEPQNLLSIGVGTGVGNDLNGNSALMVAQGGRTYALSFFQTGAVVGTQSVIALGSQQSGGIAIPYATISSYIDDITAGAASGSFIIKTRLSGTLGERLRVLSNGNVGIGTTAPGAKLELQDSLGNIPSFKIGTLTDVEIVHNSVIGQIMFTGEDNSAGYTRYNVGAIKSIAYRVDGGTWGSASPTSSEGTALAFFTITDPAGGGALTEQMRIDRAGNVGIGTTAPLSKLQVHGNVSVQGTTMSKINGSLMIGTGTPRPNIDFGSGSNADLFVADDFQTKGSIYGANSDLAEIITAANGAKLEPGDVVVIDTESDGVKLCTEKYQTTVAGVISTKPGMVLGSENLGVELALAGQVPMKVTSENGSIKRGDLLTTSSTPGHAMKCDNRNKCTGAIVGKALENFDGKEGKISVLVTLA